MSFLHNLPTELQDRIVQVTQINPESLNIFEELYEFLTREDNKKRKIANSVDDYYEIDSIDPDTIIFQLKDLSFQSPIRKKLNLTFSISLITQKPILSIGKNNEQKPDLVIDELNNDNIYFSSFLPVPEKPHLLYFVLFYRTNLNDVFGNDPIVLTLNKEQINKQLLDEKIIKEGTDPILYIYRQAQLSGFKILETFNTNFNSFLVEAHKGTKEGFLYFLPNHILFGFKKPILLFNSKDIESFSYSSITRITFNVTLVLKNGEKHEFSMIDQIEYNKIDSYIKNREFLDTSMSDELKAKSTNKNQESTGALAEASNQLIDGLPIELAGEEDSDDEEEDASFQVGVEESGESKSESEEDEEEEEESEEFDESDD